MGSPRTPRIDRARADDVLQVAVDRAGRVPMVIGALLVLDPDSRPSAHEVRTVLLRRAASVPRLGQRLATTPPGAGRAVWLDAGSLALAGRVDSTLVSGLGAASGPDPDPDRRARVTRRALLDATAELVLERLPAHELLWRARLLLAPGGGVAAIALVAHHALADGMGGLAVLGALADPPAGVVRDHTASGAPGGRSPEAVPPWAALVREAWSGRLGRRAGEDRGRRRRAAGHRGGTGRAGRARGGVRRLAGGLGELGLGRPRLAARCSLLGRTGDRRHLELVTVDLAAVRATAQARGATINDVVVTAVTGALVELLAGRGERTDELVVSVPVSRRRQGEAGALGNETGVVPVRVPGVADASRRLAALVAQRSRVRAPGRGGSAAVLTPAFRALAAVGAFQSFVDHQRLVHTFVTNVRGPAQRLRFAGAEVSAVVPVAVSPGNVAVSFDVLSYAGTLGVTLVCDPALVPESAWLAERVTAGLTASG